MLSHYIGSFDSGKKIFNVRFSYIHPVTCFLSSLDKVNLQMAFTSKFLLQTENTKQPQ